MARARELLWRDQRLSRSSSSRERERERDWSRVGGGCEFYERGRRENDRDRGGRERERERGKEIHTNREREGEEMWKKTLAGLLLSSGRGRGILLEKFSVVNDGIRESNGLAREETLEREFANSARGYILPTTTTTVAVGGGQSAWNEVGGGRVRPAYSKQQSVVQHQRAVRRNDRGGWNQSQRGISHNIRTTQHAHSHVYPYTANARRPNENGKRDARRCERAGHWRLVKDRRKQHELLLVRLIVRKPRVGGGESRARWSA